MCHPRLQTVFVAATILIAAAAAAFAQLSSSQARAVQPASVLGDLFDMQNAIDERPTTRASSGRIDYAGLSVMVDLNSEQIIVGVIQDHGRWSDDCPGAYKIEVASATSGPWVGAFEGQGRRAESRAMFEPVRARFIRITATSRRGGGDEWSIAELRVLIDPSARPRRPGERPPDWPASGRLLKDLPYATDGNMETRAASNGSDYAGMVGVFDLGGEDRLSRVVQIHGRWPDDYPAEYKVEVSRRNDEGEFREVWRGRGEPERSVAEFAPVNARYVRITALRNRDAYHWWSIAELRTGDREPFDRDDDRDRVTVPIRRVTAHGFSHPEAVLTEGTGTRATTERADYAGSWLQAELDGGHLVSRVVQVHAPSDNDYPGRYKVEASEDGRRWQTVWEGSGSEGRSRANFTPVRARYVRITAAANWSDRRWWSISTLRISRER